MAFFSLALFLFLIDLSRLSPPRNLTTSGRRLQGIYNYCYLKTIRIQFIMYRQSLTKKLNYAKQNFQLIAEQVVFILTLQSTLQITQISNNVIFCLVHNKTTVGKKLHEIITNNEYENQKTMRLILDVLDTAVASKYLPLSFKKQCNKSGHICITSGS